MFRFSSSTKSTLLLIQPFTQTLMVELICSWPDPLGTTQCLAQGGVRNQTTSCAALATAALLPLNTNRADSLQKRVEQQSCKGSPALSCHGFNLKLQSSALLSKLGHCGRSCHVFDDCYFPLAQQVTAHFFWDEMPTGAEGFVFM